MPAILTERPLYAACAAVVLFLAASSASSSGLPSKQGAGSHQQGAQASDAETLTGFDCPYPPRCED